MKNSEKIRIKSTVKIRKNKKRILIKNTLIND